MNGEFDAGQWVTEEEEGVFVATCPVGDYTGRRTSRPLALKGLAMHHRAKHRVWKVLEKIVQHPEACDPVDSIEHMEDAVFENRLRQLTEGRRWSEVAATCLMHGSVLIDRQINRK